jgi:hypothetical protein
MRGIGASAAGPHQQVGLPQPVQDQVQQTPRRAVGQQTVPDLAQRGMVKPGPVNSSPRRNFQSIRPRRAAADWRSDRPSTDR